MRPRADPETPFMEAAPVAKAIGLPVVVGAVTTPVEATETAVGTAAVEEATPGTMVEAMAVEVASQAKTVTVTLFPC